MARCKTALNGKLFGRTPQSLIALFTVLILEDNTILQITLSLGLPV